MNSRFSPSALRAFELFFQPWMKSRLSAVRIAGPPAPLPSDCPLLLVPNHVSWWDGFILLEVHRAIRPAAPLYTLMSEPALRRFPFFRSLGVVGIEVRSPRSIAAVLRFLETRIRERADASIVLFPQGRIWPSYRRPLGFRRGVELFARRLNAIVLPVGLHIEPLNAARPTAFASIGAPLTPPILVDRVEHGVQQEIDRVLDFLAVHGEDAPRAWPPAGRRDGAIQISAAEVP